MWGQRTPQKSEVNADIRPDWERRVQRSKIGPEGRIRGAYFTNLLLALKCNKYCVFLGCSGNRGDNLAEGDAATRSSGTRHFYRPEDYYGSPRTMDRPERAFGVLERKPKRRLQDPRCYPHPSRHRLGEVPIKFRGFPGCRSQGGNTGVLGIICSNVRAMSQTTFQGGQCCSC